MGDAERTSGSSRPPRLPRSKGSASQKPVSPGTPPPLPGQSPPPLKGTAFASVLGGKGLYAMAGVGLGAVLAVGVGLAVLLTTDSEEGNSPSAAGPDNVAEGTSEGLSATEGRNARPSSVTNSDSPDGRAETTSVDRQQRPAPVEAPSVATEESRVAENGQGPSPESDDSPNRNPPPGQPHPLADIRARNRQLILPKRNFGLGGTTHSVEIAKVFVPSPAHCRLSLLGGDVVLGSDRELALTAANEPDGARSWTVTNVNAGAVGQAKKEVGTFQLQEKTLTFAWNPGALPAQAARLGYCLLEVEAGGESEVCFLSEPRKTEPVKLNLSKQSQSVRIPVELSLLPPAEHLRLDLQFEGMRHKDAKSQGLPVDETAVFTISRGRDPGETVDVEVAWKVSEDQTSGGLEIRPMASGERMTEDGRKRNVRQAMSLSDVKQWQRNAEIEAQKAKREALTILKRLGQVRKAEEKLEALLRNLKAKQDPTQKNARDLQSQRLRKRIEEVELQLKQAEVTVDRLEKAQKESEGVQRFAKQTEEWCGNMLVLYDQLHDKGLIRFRLYVDLKGHQVPILETSPAPR